MEENVYDILKNRSEKLCVFSTASAAGKTESAVVGYGITEDLTIIISTKRSTRKVANLSENHHASFVTGFGFDEMNIQIDGTATVVTEGPEYEKLDAFFFTQNPNAAKFKSDETIFIRLKPTWIRTMDHTTHPGTVEEKFLS